GFEWSTRAFGHFNVVLRERDDGVVSPKGDASRPETLWQRLREGHALTIPHHSAMTRRANDWDHYDPRFMRVAEIYQSDHGGCEVKGGFRQSRDGCTAGRFVQDALARGLELGLVASTDHGRGAAYAGVLAERLDRESIFDALYARRCFAATTKGMLVD